MDRLAAIYDCTGKLWKYDHITEEHRIWLMETLGYRATYIPAQPETETTHTPKTGAPHCPIKRSHWSTVPYAEVAVTA